MQTSIGINSPQAVKRWATALAVDYAQQRWWGKFTGTGEASIVQERVDLEQAAGDEIRFDLSMRLRKKPTYGDRRLEGNEERLTFLQDKVVIDQMRKAADGGGRMTRKRTLHDLRTRCKTLTADYAAEWMDEVMFIYASGSFGANEDSLFETDDEFVSETNPLEAPDAAHLMYGGDATGKADLATADVMNTTVIEKVANKAKMLNSRDRDVVQMRGIKEGGTEHFVLLMNPDQHYSLRTASAATDWLEVQKKAGVRGSQNPIFTAALGHYAGVALHEHHGIRRFTDYGSGSDVAAARALFLGRQALTCAYGGGNRSRMTWVEKLTDYENGVSIAAGMICGVKKTRFKPEGAGTGTDFAVIAIDTAAADPNA